MDTITLEQAQRIALRQLVEIAPERALVILADRTTEYSFGWVFSFVPEKFLKSQNPSDLVLGLGPLVVNRDRTAAFLPSSVPPEIAIENHRREWEASHPKP